MWLYVHIIVFNLAAMHALFHIFEWCIY